MEGSVSAFAIIVTLIAVQGDVIKGIGSSSHYIVKESELNNLMYSPAF
jgi:CTP-dependent riboflavin kinase